VRARPDARCQAPRKIRHGVHLDDLALRQGAPELQHAVDVLAREGAMAADGIVVIAALPISSRPVGGSGHAPTEGPA
jgi:hypothetical protein